MKKKLGTLVAMLALAVPSMVWSAAPAHAAGWLGGCWKTSGRTWTSGWCDGNGPDYTYRSEIKCSNGKSYATPYTRWAGDRRGTSATCPSGYRLASYIHVFYKGSSYRYY